MSSPRIAIVGAGISGLSAALACHRAGLKPIVFETKRFIECKTGILLWHNALTALNQILGPKQFRSLLSKSSKGTMGGVRSWNGNYIISLDSVTKVLREKISRQTDDIPLAIGVERNDLLNCLAEELPSECILSNEEFISYDVQDGKVRAKLKSGKEIEADILVGAGGIMSSVRKKAFPEVEPEYTGITAFTAVSNYPICDHLPEGYMAESWGSGKKCALIRLPNEKVYWYLLSSQETNIHEESYRDELKPYLLELFGHFHEPVRSVIESCDINEVVKVDVYEVKPAKRYISGPVAIMGDAAHALPPNLGHNGCLAIEDACQFAQSLFQHKNDLMKGLEEYQSVRTKRNSSVFHILSGMTQLGKMDRLTNVRDKILSILPSSMKENQLVKIVDYQVKMDFIEKI